MMRRALTLAILAGAAVVPLHGQTTPRDQARTVMPPALFQDVDALAAAAMERGIPADPLFNKALEGMAKHVPQGLLMTALRGYSDRLGTARMAFGVDAGPPMLVAGADALQRGVGPEALRDLGEGSMHSPMAVLVLADLIETGVPSDRALEVLHEAMGQRMSGDMMLEIPDHVRGFMREGRSPGAAAEMVWSRMRGGMGGIGSMGGWTMGAGGMLGSGGSTMGPGVPPGWTPTGGGDRHPGGGP